MNSKDSIFKKIQPYQKEFSLLFKDAMRDGLNKVNEFVFSNKYLEKYLDWPSLSYATNKLPKYSFLTSGPIDYRACFRDLRNFGRVGNYIDESDIESFLKLSKFLSSKE